MDSSSVKIKILPVLVPRKPTYEKDYSRILKKNI